MTIVSARDVATFNPPAEENTTLLVVVTTVDAGIPVDTVVWRDDASIGLVHV